jgi:hypothetical protein
MPRALKAVSRSSRFLAEGRERDRTGATVVDFDPNDWTDYNEALIGVGLGFQPTKLSQQWDYLTAQKEVQDYWKGQRQVLMSEFYRAHRLKDKEGKTSAIAAIKRFNEQTPDRALRITSKSLVQSVKTRTRVKAMKEKGLPSTKYLRGVAKQVDTLFPEVVHRQKLKKD